MDYTVLEQYIASQLGERRLAHTYSTARQTHDLLVRYVPHIPPQEGIPVGLWHDAARAWQPEDLRRYCAEHRIPLEPEEEANAVLLHGPVAAHLLPRFWPGCKTSWQAAVRWHTLGSKDMGALGAALFAADYLEPLRAFHAEGEREALLASGSLEEMVLRILERERAFLERRGDKPAGCTSVLCDWLASGGQFEA